MSPILLMAPMLAQALMIAIDEFYFHWRRGLPLWEKINHPIDTLISFSCLSLVGLCPFTAGFGGLYTALAVISCLAVTRDEFVHKKLCSGAELWLHSLLFLIHPLLFIAGWMIWPRLGENPLSHTIYLVYLGSMLVFFMYQLVYWFGLRSTEPAVGAAK